MIQLTNTLLKKAWRYSNHLVDAKKYLKSCIKFTGSATMSMDIKALLVLCYRILSKRAIAPNPDEI